MSNFQDRIKNLRKEFSLTQNELAERLNYTQGNISGWENGSVEPKASALEAVAAHFNVSVDYLLGRTDELGGVVATASPTGEQLTDNERTLLNWFRGLPSEKARASFLSFLDSSGSMFAAKRN